MSLSPVATAKFTNVRLQPQRYLNGSPLAHHEVIEFTVESNGAIVASCMMTYAQYAQLIALKATPVTMTSTMGVVYDSMPPLDARDRHASAISSVLSDFSLSLSKLKTHIDGLGEKPRLSDKDIVGIRKWVNEAGAYIDHIIPKAEAEFDAYMQEVTASTVKEVAAITAIMTTDK